MVKDSIFRRRKVWCEDCLLTNQFHALLLETFIQERNEDEKSKV